jgi:hypothetical protein
MADRLHFPLKPIMCQWLVSLMCLLANNSCIIKHTSNLSMYAIIYVLTVQWIITAAVFCLTIYFGMCILLWYRKTTSNNLFFWGNKLETYNPCRGLVPWVSWVAGYDPKFWTLSVPSSGKLLGNHKPHTGHGPTPPGRRRGATNLKRTNPRAIHIFASPHHVKDRWAWFHHLSGYSTSYLDPGRTPASRQSTRVLPLLDKHGQH